MTKIEEQISIKSGGELVVQRVESMILGIRGVNVILDADVADLYGVETKRINEAVKNNPDKFPEDYMFVLTDEELQVLRSTSSTSNVLRSKFSTKSRTLPKAFTEKGLYMLATILRSKKSIEVTFAIIETFVKVRKMKRELLDLHNETDKNILSDKMNHFSDVLSDIVMPDLETSETESILELNFIIGKIKHTVKRIRKNSNNE
ncbi:MAG: ORF6N domain-containing protein [Bacteroidales bacterium]|nr:ORF6N domain-containing protein [Bacteroidales bacterium]